MDKNLTKIGQEFDKNWTKWKKMDNYWTKIGQNWLKLDKIGQKDIIERMDRMNQDGLKLDKMDQNWTKSLKQTRTKLDKIRQKGQKEQNCLK